MIAQIDAIAPAPARRPSGISTSPAAATTRARAPAGVRRVGEHDLHLRPGQRRAVARLELYARRTGACATRASRRRRRASATGRKQMNRLYVVESTPTTSDAGRSPAAAQGRPSRRLRARWRAGSTPVRRRQPPAEVPRLGSVAGRDLQAARGRSIVIAGEGQPAACTRSFTRSTRRLATSARPSPTRDGRSPADEPAGRPARAGRRDERRHGRLPADPRWQPGLHRAGRSEVRRRARQGAASRTPRAARRRDRREVPGTCRRRTTSKCGATSAPTTAR